MTNEEEVRYYRNMSNKLYTQAMDLLQKSDEYWETSEVLYWMDVYDKEGV